MSIRADAESLRAIPIFADCDSVPLQIMAFTSERQEFSIGEELITQGKKARAAFLILNGRVKLRASGQDIGMAEPGAFLGENAMIGGGVYAISAVANDIVTTARISQELFVRVTKEYPEFGKMVVRKLAEKLDQSVRELDSVRVLLNRARNFSDI